MDENEHTSNEVSIAAGSIKRYILRAIRNHTNTMTAAHVLGSILLDNALPDEECDIRILFDTGALCGNYVSKETMANLTDKLKPERIYTNEVKIGLADNKTVLSSQEAVKLHLKIHSEIQPTIEFVGDFQIMDIPEGELIIGLPTILNQLWEFVKHLLGHRASNFTRMEEDIKNVNAIRDIEQLLLPWNTPNQKEAPEEVEVPLPAQFDFASSFLKMPYTNTRRCGKLTYPESLGTVRIY